MLIFSIIFAIAFGVVIFTFIKTIGQWNKNNHSPRLTVTATIVTKRKSVSHHHHHTDTSVYVTNDTTYYVTFQVESGDKMELSLSRSEYGKLTEGDKGRLSFQGTRFLDFEK